MGLHASRSTRCNCRSSTDMRRVVYFPEWELLRSPRLIYRIEEGMPYGMPSLVLLLLLPRVDILIHRSVHIFLLPHAKPGLDPPPPRDRGNSMREYIDYCLHCFVPHWVDPVSAPNKARRVCVDVGGDITVVTLYTYMRQDLTPRDFVISAKHCSVRNVRTVFV